MSGRGIGDRQFHDRYAALAAEQDETLDAINTLIKLITPHVHHPGQRPGDCSCAEPRTWSGK